MNLPDWSFWPLYALAAIALFAVGFAFIKFTLRLPELVRAFVAVICGGLFVIFASFRIMVALHMPTFTANAQVPVGFDMVPLVLQASLLSGFLVLSYLVGVLWAERLYTRGPKKNSIMAGANS